MSVPSQTRLGWLRYSHGALRLLVTIEALSQDGWTEPITQAELGRAAHIRHRQTLGNALDEIAGEIGITRVSARRACYGLRCLFEAGNVQKVNGSLERSEIERSGGEEQVGESVQKVSDTEERSKNERLQDASDGGANVQKMNVSEERSESERSDEAGPAVESVQKLNVSEGGAQPIVQKMNGSDADRSEIERSDGERVGVKESFTESDSSDQSDQDAPCDNGNTPAVADDVRSLLRMSVDRIMKLAGDGKFPRERMLEVAKGEEIVASEEGREARVSLIQRATEFHFRVPQVDARRMFGAICTAFGYDPKSLTINEQGAINKTAAQLVKAGRKPEDVAVIYAYCKRQNWSGGFKPTALLNHASAALKTSPAPATQSDEAPIEDEAQTQEAPALPTWWGEGLREPGPARMTPADAWMATLGQLRLMWGERALDGWVDEVQLARYADGQFTLIVPDAGRERWWTRRHEPVASILTGFFGVAVNLEIRLLDEVLIAA